MKKHNSTIQKGLSFWAAPVDLLGMIGGTRCFAVVSQVKGFPATEACDDWFANEKDADEYAQKLSKGEL